MRASSKYLLILALLGLVGGVFVASSDMNLPLALEVVMPLGAIFTGLFLVSLLLKKEVVKFNEDERLKNEAIKLYQSSLSSLPKKDGEKTFGSPHPVEIMERKAETRRERTEEEAVELRRNEGDPN
jgi:hypothetical protein